MKLILGSASQYRRAVLEGAGYEFEVISPDIDEKAIRTTNHYELPLMLARAKREALVLRLGRNINALLITADQVVVCNGYLHEKPVDAEEVKLFFSRYGAGYAAETVSALAVININNGKRAEGVDIAKTYYTAVPSDVIEQFIKEGDPFSKAGGFAIQSPVLQPYLKKIEGTRDSVFGLPLDLFKRLIDEVK